jgi:hypothetical protein
MRIACGQKYNLLERGSVTVSSEHAQLTKDRLFDGRPSRAYRAAAAATDLLITVDGNIVLNPGLETWSGGAPANWIKTGTVVETTVGGEVRSGSASKHSLAGLLQQDVTVKSGQNLKIDLWAMVSGGSTAGVRVYNPQTGRYLVAGGASWSSTPTEVLTTTSTTYFNLTQQFAMESFAACGYRDLTTLRIIIGAVGGGGSSFFDDVTLYPGTNFASIHGHNLDPTLSLELRSDSAAFAGAGTLESTFAQPVVVPAAYLLLGSTKYLRYWRLKAVGTPTAAQEIGEAAICEVRQPLEHYETPVHSGSRWDRQSSATPGGERHVHKRSKWQVRTRAFTYHFESQAAYDDGMELFHLRSEGDTYPAIVVPDTALSTVIHGRLRAEFPDSRVLPDLYVDVPVELEESPFAPSAF